jgi:hypothetical protein
MRVLNLDDFSEKIGASYDILVDGGAVAVTLTELQKLPHAVREGGSFRLVFRGPTDPVLPQAIYPFRHAGEVDDIFIVPVARDQAGTQYEAIFF